MTFKTMTAAPRAAALFLCLAPIAASAEDTPSAAVAVPASGEPGQLLGNELYRRLVVSPNESAVAIVAQGYPSAEELNAPLISVYNVKVDASTGARSPDPAFTIGFDPNRWSSTLTLVDLKTKQKLDVAFPLDLKYRSGAWSPDGNKFAFVRKVGNEHQLWLADLRRSPRVSLERIGKVALAKAAEFEFAWRDNESVIVNVEVDNLRLDTSPGSPVADVRDNRDDAPPFSQRTPGDETKYLLGFLSTLTLSGEASRFSTDGITKSVVPSPDGRGLISKVQIEPGSREGAGDMYKIFSITRNDIIETGSLKAQWASWQPDQPHRLVRVDIDGKIETTDTFGDRWAAAGQMPLTEVQPEWLPDGSILARKSGANYLSTPGDFQKWKNIVASIKPSFCGIHCSLNPMKQKSSLYDWPVLLAKDGFLYETGMENVRDQKSRRFISRISLKSGRRNLTWRSPSDAIIKVLAPLSNVSNEILAYVGDGADEKIVQFSDTQPNAREVLSFPDPAPAFSNLKRREIYYSRPDGLPMSATVYLPPNYIEGAGALPTIFWIYPRQLMEKGRYVTDLPREAKSVNWRPFRNFNNNSELPLALPLSGYAVVFLPDMPVFGIDGGESGTFSDQMADNMSATVREVVRLGIADPARLAVGGHSRGALESLKLLANTRIFRTAVSVSGPANLTIFPRFAQFEDRTYWQAPEAYVDNSPALIANRMRGSALVIHGSADARGGSFWVNPLDAYSLYESLDQNKLRVRMVVIPGEEHHFFSKEGLVRTMNEIREWLDTELSVK